MGVPDPGPGEEKLRGPDRDAGQGNAREGGQGATNAKGWQEGEPDPVTPRLRDTFATAAHEAGISTLDQKILLNRKLPMGDVTEGYQRPSDQHLRASIERIAQFLLTRMKM